MVERFAKKRYLAAGLALLAGGYFGVKDVERTAKDYLLSPVYLQKFVEYGLDRDKALSNRWEDHYGAMRALTDSLGIAGSPFGAGLVGLFVAGRIKKNKSS